MLNKPVKQMLCIIMAMAFLWTSVDSGHAVELSLGTGGGSLPAPGQLVNLSSAFQPPVLKGVKVYADEPFRFDFILDKGDRRIEGVGSSEANKLIRYFLTSLTVPENDLWVNLSPYEKDRIISDEFGMTEMGRDLLAQDYLLKQLTASVIYPEGETGKKFWAEVYKKAFEKYGTTDIPVDTFNKVWIVPAEAVVYEKQAAWGGERGKDQRSSLAASSLQPAQSVAYVVKAKLKVMLESDYLAQSNSSETRHQKSDNSSSQAMAPTMALAKDVLREVVIPVLEKDVNEGANFAQLRQVYYSLILAAWYKRKVKDSLVSAVYVDQKKIKGVNIDDPKMSEKIWAQYVAAFKSGAYNYIKEERDQFTDELIPRKYFSGGLELGMANVLSLTTDDAQVTPMLPGRALIIDMAMNTVGLGSGKQLTPEALEVESLIEMAVQAKEVWRIRDKDFSRRFSALDAQEQQLILSGHLNGKYGISPAVASAAGGWGYFGDPWISVTEDLISIISDYKGLVSLLKYRNTTGSAGKVQDALWRRLKELSASQEAGVWQEIEAHFEGNSVNVMSKLDNVDEGYFVATVIQSVLKSGLSRMEKERLANRVLSYAKDMIGQGNELGVYVLYVVEDAIRVLEPARKYDEQNAVRALGGRQEREALYVHQILTLSQIYRDVVAQMQGVTGISYDEVLKVLLKQEGFGLLTQKQVVQVKKTILEAFSIRNGVHRRIAEARRRYPLEAYEALARVVMDAESRGFEDEQVRRAREEMEVLRQGKYGVVAFYQTLFGEGAQVPRFIFLDEGLLNLSIDTEKGGVMPLYEGRKNTVKKESVQEATMTSYIKDYFAMEDQKIASSLDVYALRKILSEYPYSLFDDFQDEMVAYLTSAELRGYHVEDFIEFYRYQFDQRLQGLIRQHIKDRRKQSEALGLSRQVWSDNNPTWRKTKQVIRGAKAFIDELVDLRATMLYDSMRHEAGLSEEEAEKRCYVQASEYIIGILQFVPMTKLNRLVPLRDEWRAAVAGKQKLSREVKARNVQYGDQSNDWGIAGFARPWDRLIVNGIGFGKEVRAHEDQHSRNGLTMAPVRVNLRPRKEYAERFVEEISHLSQALYKDLSSSNFEGLAQFGRDRAMLTVVNENTVRVREEVSAFRKAVFSANGMEAKLKLIVPKLAVDGKYFGKEGSWIDLRQGASRYAKFMGNIEAHRAWALAWESRLILFDLIHEPQIGEEERQQRIALASEEAKRVNNGNGDWNEYLFTVGEIADGYWEEGMRSMGMGELAGISQTMVVAGKAGLTNFSPLGQYPVEPGIRAGASRNSQGVNPQGPHVIFRMPSILNENGYYGAGLPYRGIEQMSDEFLSVMRTQGLEGIASGQQRLLANYNLFMIGSEIIDVAATRELNRSRIGKPRHEKGISQQEFQKMDEYLSVIEQKQKIQSDAGLNNGIESVISLDREVWAAGGRKGGIDLNPVDKMLQLNGDGSALKFNIDPAMVRQYQAAPGFMPVILNIRPLDDLPAFLGVSEQKPAASAA